MSFLFWRNVGQQLQLNICIIFVFCSCCQRVVAEDIDLYQRGSDWLGTVELSQINVSSKIADINAAVVFRSSVMHGDEDAQHVTIDVRDAMRLWLFTGDAGDGIGADHSVWGDARIKTVDGEWIYLDSLKPILSKVGYGQLKTEPVEIGGRGFEHGLSAHAKSCLGYVLDGGYTEFEGWVGLNETAEKRGSVTFVCSTYPENPDYRYVVDSVWEKLKED